MEVLKLFLPFDEADGSTVAFDYASGAHHATVHNGQFIEGREGNVVYFPAEGYAEIIDSILDLTATYTVMFWVLANQTGMGTGESFFAIKFPEPDQYLKLDLNTNLSIWTHIALTHDNGVYCTFTNGRRRDIETVNPAWGDATGFCMAHNNGYDATGYCQIYNYKIIEGVAYSEQALSEVISTATIPVKFIIDGVDLKSIGVTVAKERGLTDKLPIKDSNSFNWKDQHGTQVDLAAPRYDVRTIELDCWFKATGTDAQLETQMTIRDLFNKPGTVRLRAEVATKPFIYEVYHPGQIDFSDGKWRSGPAFRSFKLTLVELQPIKKILRHIKVDGTTPDVSITLTTPNLLTVFWGDGSLGSIEPGTNLTITHHYTIYDTYDILIAGVIEDITNFSTNAIVVWNKFLT